MNQYKTIPFSIIFFTLVFCVNSVKALDSASNTSANNNYSSQTVEDFNRDGAQDLLVKDANRHTDTLYLNNGDGGFQEAGKAAAGMNPPQIQMADLNADGKPDLIGTNSRSGGVFGSVGLGNGKFKPRVHYLKGSKPLSVQVGDVNDDNNIDLVVINFEQNSASVLYGDGNANFMGQEADPTSLDSMLSSPTAGLTTDNPGGSDGVSTTDQAGQTQGVETGVTTPKLTKQSSKAGRALITKAATTAALEQSIQQKINAYRATRRLPALALNSTISNVARTHSQNIASGRVAFGHSGFQTRVNTLAKTLTFRAAAENVAYNWGYSDPAATAVNGWLKSTGHLNNIVGNYNLTGIGVAKNSKGAYYFTQIFWRR